jgi:quercetin dioxygenase-like cupin family protein
MVTLFPDRASAKHPTARPLEEFAMVFAGTVTLTLGDEPDQVLETGDAASIRAGVPRRWQNPSSEQAQILVVTARFAL